MQIQSDSAGLRPDSSAARLSTTRRGPETPEGARGPNRYTLDARKDSFLSSTPHPVAVVVTCNSCGSSPTSRSYRTYSPSRTHRKG